MPEASIFAVLDVETTGFSPLTGDRIIEIAVVRVAPDLSIVDEFVTLVNPRRPIGRSELHGITEKDVQDAPTFEDIAGDVLERLEDLVIVGHNVRYDRDFLAAELSAAGVFLPSIPCLDTLKLAHRLHPEYLNHRMSTCCSEAGLDHSYPHDALEEARATVRLLSHFLQEAEGSGITMADVLDGELKFPKPWPQIPPSGRAVRREGERTIQETVPFLARLAAQRGGTAATEALAPYVDLLDRALEDRRVTAAEARALGQTAKAWGLSAADVRSANEAYLRGVVAAALADGWITMNERNDLRSVVALLDLDPSLLDSLISEVAEDSS